MTAAAAGASRGSRARVIHRQRFYPDAAQLVALAAEVQALRVAAGLSQRALAARSAVNRRTLERLEAGRLRPRRSLLGSIANGVDPDRRAALLERLVAAAGDQLAADTDGTIRWRRRRMEAGILAGRVPMPSRIADALRLHRQADAAWLRSVELVDEALGLADDDPRQAVLFEHAEAAHDESVRLRQAAGPPVVLYVGRHCISAGFTAP